MKLIVGLGNPGKKYENTRHNMGFMAVDLLSDQAQIDVDKEVFHGLMGRGKIYDEELYCIEGVRKIGRLVFRFIAVYLAGILGIFETLANIGNTFQETVIFFVKSWLSNGAAIGIIYCTIVCYIMPFILSRRIYLDFDHRENSFIHILMRNYKMDELKGI